MPYCSSIVRLPSANYGEVSVFLKPYDGWIFLLLREIQLGSSFEVEDYISWTYVFEKPHDGFTELSFENGNGFVV